MDGRLRFGYHAQCANRYSQIGLTCISNRDNYYNATMAFGEYILLCFSAPCKVLLSSLAGMYPLFRYPSSIRLILILILQKKIDSIWKVDAADVNLLRSVLMPRSGPSSLPQHEARVYPDVDIRDDAMLQSSTVQLYAEISTLDERYFSARDGGEHSSVDWHSNRAWHDECVKAARRWDYDNKKDWIIWTHDVDPQYGEDEVDDSYMKRDYSLWTYLRQQERDKTLTLSPLGDGEELLASSVEDLDGITLLGDEMDNLF